jgi:phosphoesterase RecJ-like protein
VDVNRLARRFGGGGHRNASGAVIEGPLEQVKPRVLQAARSLVDGAGEAGAGGSAAQAGS